MTTTTISTGAVVSGVATAAQAEAFKRWFSAAGHWVYEYRPEAVRVLRERGINGRPRWTAELGSTLQQWVDADPLPAIIRGAA